MPRSSGYDTVYAFSIALEALRRRHGVALNNLRPMALTVASFIIDALAAKPIPVRASRQDLLDAIALICGVRQMLDEREGTLLAEARRRGITFQELASALGLRSRQAAEQRVLKLAMGNTLEEEEFARNRRRQRLHMEASSVDFTDAWVGAALSAAISPRADDESS